MDEEVGDFMDDDEDMER